MSATPTSTPAPSHSTIRRAAEDRLLVGVCGGLAKSFAVPALAVRLGAIALAVPAAPFVLTTYAVLAVVVPREDGRTLLGGTPSDPRENVIGWGIVALAAVVLLATGIDGHSGPFIDPFMVFFGAVAALAVAALTTRRVAAAESPAGPPTWTAARATAADTGTATTPSQERAVPLGDEPTFVQPTQPRTVRLPLGPPPPPRPRLPGSVAAARRLRHDRARHRPRRGAAGGRRDRPRRRPGRGGARRRRGGRRGRRDRVPPPPPRAGAARARRPARGRGDRHGGARRRARSRRRLAHLPAGHGG